MNEIEVREIYERCDVSNNRTINPLGEDEFVQQISNLIKQREVELIDKIEDSLSEKKPLDNSEYAYNWGFKNLGYNDCLSEVTTMLKQLKERL